MTYEKAELILQQLMAGDRDLYLVRGEGGKPQITDCPTDERRVIQKLPKNRPKCFLQCRSINVPDRGVDDNNETSGVVVTIYAR